MSLGVAQESAVRPELALLYQLSEGYTPRDFAIRFWDGTVAGPDSGHEARFTIVLNHPGALRRMLCSVGVGALRLAGEGDGAAVRAHVTGISGGASSRLRRSLEEG